ncbi:hypothetical protein HZA56_00245 [Candidatus Poribacteria bacterium]|nr:hypothetical protein [Candidatus Poribacteria bacterium]
MQKLFFSFVCFLLALIVISCIGKEVSVAAERGVEQADPRTRYQNAKEEYLRLKNAGYDVSSVTELLPSMKEAVEARNFREANRILTEAETKLAEIEKQGSSATGTGIAPSTESVKMAARKFEPVRIAPNFGFGVEYTDEGLARTYREMGANWAKIPLVDWGRVEPEAPRGSVHRYEWKKLDGLVKEYQSQGFKLTVVLKARSKWGSTPVQKEHAATLGYPSTPPKPEYWDAYARFISSIVERYDNDGVDDMPGLKSPISSYEVESEAQHNLYWQGTIEDYVKVLKTTYQAAKKADPNVKIILSGLSFGDLFDDQAPSHLVEQKVESFPAQKQGFLKHSLGFIKETLKAGDYFDEVEFHYLNDYRGAYGEAEFIRSEMRRNGYEKPIWAGDATAAPFLIPTPFSMHPFMSPETGASVYGEIANPRGQKHDETMTWYLGEQAKILVKKFVAGMEVGLHGIMMGNTKDWIGFQDRNFVYQGLIDANKKPRPAYYAYKMLIEKLKDAETLERLQNPPNVYAYRFSRKGKSPVYVAWAEEKDTLVTLPISTKEAAVTRTPTSLAKKGPNIEKMQAKEGALKITIGSAPVFVEEVR